MRGADLTGSYLRGKCILPTRIEKIPTQFRSFKYRTPIFDNERFKAVLLAIERLAHAEVRYSELEVGFNLF